jgi:hypothetical protein
MSQTIPEGLTVEQALGIIENIRSEVIGIDAIISDINARYLQEWTPWNERKTKLMSAWQALYELLPYLPPSVINPSAPAPEPPPEAPSVFAEKKGRTTPRSLMLELLRATIGPVSPDALWAAVQHAGLQTKMTGAELVYQTLYAARKKGHPIERNDDGSWFWKREAAA